MKALCLPAFSKNAFAFFPILFLLTCLGPARVYAQVVDTTAVETAVDSLLMEANKLRNEGKNEEALPLAQQAAYISKQQWGENNAIYAASLHRLASVYANLGQIDTAEVMYLKAIDLRAKVLGMRHPDYVASMNNLAILYNDKGDYEEAGLLYLEIKDIRAKTLGKEHTDYATSLDALATCYYYKGDYAKAEPLYLEAKEIRAKILGKEHPDYASSLNNLAMLYLENGDYSKSELLSLEAKEIFAKTLGKEHVFYANSLSTLAGLYYYKGNYYKSEPLLLEAKDIRAKALGKEHPDYASSLYNLANLYSDKGDYEKAEPLYLEAITIETKTLGKEHPEYALSLNVLAILYSDKGDYEKAEPLYLEAIAILAKTLGKEHPNYARSLNALAALYMSKGDYAKAEPLFLEVKNIQAKVLGKEHPDYIGTLCNLANVSMHKDDYTKAELQYLEASELWVKILGKEHPSYATSLFNLAIVYYYKCDYAKAGLLYLEAKEIRANIFGKEHPDYAESLSSLAGLYQGVGRIIESATLFLELNNLIRRLIEKSATYSTESQMLAYLKTFDDDIDQFQSFSQVYSNLAFTRATFDNALFYNGYLLENARHLARSVAEADSLTRLTYGNWQDSRRSLGNEYAKPVVERRNVVKLEAEAESYEKALTRSLPAFGATRQVSRWQDVRDRLRPGEAAIEFIHYRFYTPKATDSTIYAALVLLPGDTCPHFVPLCEQQQQLDSLLHQKYQDKRYARQSGAASLYSLLWQPIEPLLKGVRTIYYAPSGALHSINLDAIALNTLGDSTLIDKYKLVRLGSTRQLVSPVTAKIEGNDALLFGGIRYESDSTAIQNENHKNRIAMRGESEEGLPEPADSLRQIRALEPLPSTLTEVEFIRKRLLQKKFNAPMFTGFGASEEAFKYLADSISASGTSARVLHLATHGYFFPDPKSSERPGSGFREEPGFRIIGHPFLRSGLVLAGGNHAWQTGKPFKEGMEDGILTAYEISTMSLKNTELVVLSACETGLGDVSGNEGVYGLQRAFKIAGAQYLIMSLWTVSDDATKDLMSAFYRNWLDEKMDIPAAFRSAQLEMKAKYKDPEMWAGFVLVQ